MNQDCLLVKAILSGHYDRFEELVEMYKDRIFSMSYRFTNNMQESQDLSQEIFITVYKNLNSFKGESALSTWIYKVSFNRCLDWKRKHQRRNKLSSFVHRADDEDYDRLEHISDTTPGPEDELLTSEQSSELHDAIKKLPEKYQSVIILYHFQQLTYQEISTILGLPVRTVETHLYRAKLKLRNLLTHHVENGVKKYEYIRS